MFDEGRRAPARVATTRPLLPDITICRFKVLRCERPVRGTRRIRALRRHYRRMIFDCDSLGDGRIIAFRVLNASAANAGQTSLMERMPLRSITVTNNDRVCFTADNEYDRSLGLNDTSGQRT